MAATPGASVFAFVGSVRLLLFPGVWRQETESPSGLWNTTGWHGRIENSETQSYNAPHPQDTLHASALALPNVAPNKKHVLAVLRMGWEADAFLLHHRHNAGRAGSQWTHTVCGKRSYPLDAPPRLKAPSHPGINRFAHTPCSPPTVVPRAATSAGFPLSLHGSL